MTEAILKPDAIDLSQIVTEDDQPVDNMFSAYQQRLLVEPLYSAWKPARSFLANANVGIFESPYEPPIVPDMWLSLDVTPPGDWQIRERRAYFIWEFLKAPEVVVELVSNRKGGEASRKVNRYERLRIWYYVVFDPGLYLSDQPLQLYEYTIGGYRLRDDWQLEHVGLRLTLWDGVYEQVRDRWLRWCLPDGTLIPTGAERAEKLAAQLRALGIEPEA